MRSGTGEILMQLRDGGAMSRADLARITGLSSASVTKLTARMVQSGLIEDLSGPHSQTMGRPPVRVALRNDACAAVAVHMGAGKVNLALSDLGLGLTEMQSFEFDLDTPVDDVIQRTIGLVRRAVLASGLPMSKLVGVGIGLPGGVDGAKRGSTSSVISGWNDIAFADAFEEALGLPATVEHNATAMAMAEAIYTRTGPTDSILYVLVDKGTGGGFAQPGSGGRRGPVELGHLAVEPGGPRCICGGEGCLEVFFSERGLKALAPAGATTPADMFAAAMASAEWPKIYEYILQAFSTSITLLAPQRIILGGLLTEAPDAFVAALEADLPHRVMPHLRRNLQIGKPGLSEPVGVKGAASIAFEKFFYEQGPVAALAKPARNKRRA
ncbi:ROK family transcriptional regulator [Falsirhodobacter sp. alg1]|uniref:ROK family transcriptional regulator n=1 Tax=Falsirhodobacter sp. alg1 TaxID=1472418 RepID=UPI0007880339|nr:ROK family transcriptional regulator [Falsirhodobacter sp. alg1]